MRSSQISRNTSETEVAVALNIDGKGSADIITGCGFLDHMLKLFACHGGFDLYIRCNGDTNVDYHHSTEDIGIALGKAFAVSLGDKRGICRYGSMLLPMDEALVLCAVDISGRSCLTFKLDLLSDRVGDFDCELVKEFFTAFVREAGITLHIKKLDGENTHHIIEAAFKAFGRAMKTACAIDADNSDKIPSTKGTL